MVISLELPRHQNSQHVTLNIISIRPKAFSAGWKSSVDSAGIEPEALKHSLDVKFGFGDVCIIHPPQVKFRVALINLILGPAASWLWAHVSDRNYCFAFFREEHQA
jgi:hypothetical protein